MPLTSNLYIGASGLQTSQNALNTTAHNLTNVDTVGYTRQQVQQASMQSLLSSHLLFYTLLTSLQVIREFHHHFFGSSLSYLLTTM